MIYITLFFYQHNIAHSTYMGNNTSTQEYISINGNMVECDGFDNIKISKSNENNKITTVNKSTSAITYTPTNVIMDKTNSTSNKKSLEDLIKEIENLKPHSSPIIDKSEKVFKESIERIFKDYDQNTILDYYESDEAVTLLTRNNRKSLILAQNLPKSDRGLMFKYFPDVPLELVIVMSKQINFNATNERKQTFLYEDDVFKYIGYITDLIDKIDDININLIVNRYTFLAHLIRRNYSLPNDNELSKLFGVLEAKKYNFNNFCFYNDTILTQMLMKYPGKIFNLAEMMKLKTFNISIESRWLYHILDTKLDELHNYVYYMFQREDYKKLLFNLYNNLYINVWGDKFIIFLKKVIVTNSEKTYDCLRYKDESGNTILHSMAKNHDKLTLQFCVNYFTELDFESDNMGSELLKLYNESKLANRLTQKLNG